MRRVENEEGEEKLWRLIFPAARHKRKGDRHKY